MTEDRFKEAFRRIISETLDAPVFSDLETHQATPAAPLVLKPWMAVAGAALLVMVVVGAVGLIRGGGAGVAPPLGSSTTLGDDWIIPTECPVTIPKGNFTPPAGYPSAPVDPESVWYGAADLWTRLPVDGDYGPRKSVWWSVNFVDPGSESGPDIVVQYRLLNDSRELFITEDQGTNASTPEEGLFMIAGIDPPIRGCWQVTATYKGASLSYVYYMPEGSDPSSIVVPDVVGMSVDRAGNVLNDAMYEASFVDSANPEFEVCAQEPGAGLEINPGAIIGMRTAPPGGCDDLMNPFGPNPDYETYEDELGRLWYATACPAADVLISGGVDAADGLPNAGQTEEDRVVSQLNDNVEYFLDQPGGIAVAAVPRNGEVWDRTSSGAVVVEQVADFMIELVIDESRPCPSAPWSWNGIPVAYVLETSDKNSCLGTPQIWASVVLFNCGGGDFPNPRPVEREFAAGSDPIAEAFRFLLAGPTPRESLAGLASWFNDETADAFISANLKGDHLTLDFTDDILVNNASTSAGSQLFLAELNANAFAFDEVKSVDYLINGTCDVIWEFLQYGPECRTATRVGSRRLNP